GAAALDLAYVAAGYTDGFFETGLNIWDVAAGSLLVLVAPRWPNVLRREETIQRASGALDVLHNARIVETLDEALDGISHLCATAMTPRDFGPPTRAPREHFGQLLAGAAETPPPAGVAFLFGSERFGMRNEDVYRCHVCLSIPTHPG